MIVPTVSGVRGPDAVPPYSSVDTRPRLLRPASLKTAPGGPRHTRTPTGFIINI